MDGGPWQRVLTHTLSTTYQVTNLPTTTLTFRLTATDHVSNAASAVARTSVVRVTKYYYHGATRVALRTSGAGGGVVYWLHSDHLGSVSLVTDHTSRVVAQQRFLPYGGVRYSEGTFPTDVGFTGHRGHPDLGLVYMRARYYHVALGRFVSADTVVPGAAEGSGGGLATVGYDERTRLTPLTVGFHEARFLDILNTENGELLQFGPPALWDRRVRQEHNVPMGPANPQALNRYAYCLGNPVRYVDPGGYDSGGNEVIGYEQLLDDNGAPILDAKGNPIYKVWYFGKVAYVLGDSPDLPLFIHYAEKHQQACDDWYKDLASAILVGIVFVGGTYITFATLPGNAVPGGQIVTGAAIAVTLGGLALCAMSIDDFIDTDKDIKTYSRNSWDVFWRMSNSPYAWNPNSTP